MEIFRGKASRKISMQAHTPRRGAFLAPPAASPPAFLFFSCNEISLWKVLVQKRRGDNPKGKPYISLQKRKGCREISLQEKKSNRILMPLHGNLPGKGFPEDFHAGPYPRRGQGGACVPDKKSEDAGATFFSQKKAF
jgi:hypothetical protein